MSKFSARGLQWQMDAGIITRDGNAFRFWRMPMNTDIRPAPWIDARFLENQREFPSEKLLDYQGQHIAWSWDGSEIVAADADRRALDEKLRAVGIDPLQVIHDYVENPNLSYLG
jgi:hypothetical protein